MKKIRLNVYSFAAFIGLYGEQNLGINERQNRLLKLIDWSKRIGFEGIEFPIDYFCSDKNEVLDTLKSIKKSNMDYFLDFENCDTDLFHNLIPQLIENKINVVRIKMPHLGKVFYGGNRFESPTFIESKRNFNLILEKLSKYPIVFAIENHQDLTSFELIEYAGKYNNIKINWDVGNSLSTMETVDGFINRATKYIKNIHLKDYQIKKCEGGFALVRCSLGEGVVNWAQLNSYFSSHSLDSFSIELGAHIPRICKIEKKEYKDQYTHSYNDFNQFILENSQFVHKEHSKSLNQIIEDEFIEVEKSYNFLRKL